MLLTFLYALHCLICFSNCSRITCRIKCCVGQWDMWSFRGISTFLHWHLHTCTMSQVEAFLRFLRAKRRNYLRFKLGVKRKNKKQSLRFLWCRGIARIKQLWDSSPILYDFEVKTPPTAKNYWSVYQILQLSSCAELFNYFMLKLLQVFILTTKYISQSKVFFVFQMRKV